ncbi:MAG: hypothetical protein JXR22_11735 [Prolixibacteraceae bacterium]|nr:hypothetical protein [Prolixibacteraceae bacterium]
MIHHLALTVNESSEVKDFYEEVLLFGVHHKFKLSRDLSKNIFGLEEDSEVFVMRHQDMEFELFINGHQEKSFFSHVCLAYWKSERIYASAIREGYRALIKPRQGHDTYFIWDKSGNLFEIKEIDDDETRF